MKSEIRRLKHLLKERKMEYGIFGQTLEDFNKDREIMAKIKELEKSAKKK